jgi:acyl dehydratase
VRYFEDFQPGQVFDFGRRTLTREEIVAFAREFDPQPFHLSDEGPFGGIVASGWHTIAIGSRLMVDAVVGDAAGLGSPGFEEIRWLVPVRPGDELRGRATVLDAKASEKNPDRGTVHWLFETFNQRDELVLRMKARMFFRRRPEPGAA